MSLILTQEGRVDKLFQLLNIMGQTTAAATTTMTTMMTMTTRTRTTLLPYHEPHLHMTHPVPQKKL